jgi:YHS domain-containing protein
MKNHSLFLPLLVFLLLAQSIAYAQELDFFAKKNIAIEGYDAVAYFTLGKPTKGVVSYSTQHQGITWYFSSQQHLDLFNKEPQKYIPQYGGYCAFGLAEGKKIAVSPTSWAVVNGLLYLNYNEQIHRQWKKNPSGLIEKANGNWETLKFKNGTKELKE